LLLWVFNRVGFTEVIEILREADLRLLGFSMLIFQAGVAVRAYRWWLLLHGMSIGVSYGSVAGLVYIGEFFNGVLPTPLSGDVIRILEFPNKESKATTAGIVFLDRALGLAGLLIVAFAAILYGFKSLEAKTAAVLFAITGVGLLLLTIVLRGNVLPGLLALLPKTYREALHGWAQPFIEALSGSPLARLRVAIALSIFNTMLSVANHFMVAAAVGIQLAIGLFFIFAPVVNLSLLLPTISGLGLRELGYSVLLTPFEIPSETAVALGIGVFLSRLSASLIGGIVYLIWNIRRWLNKAS